MGSVPMPACPPKLVLKLPHTAMRSAMMALEILSISAPPYSSGTSTVAMPISLALRSSSRTTPQSLCSIFSMLGMISFCANSSAVCAISLCCSLKSSGVKMSSTLRSSSSQLPPWIFVFGTTVAVAMVMSFSPPRHRVTEKNFDAVPPLCLCASVVQFLLQILENPRCPHAPAHAHGHQPVLAIAPLQLADNTRRELGAGAAQRMSQRDRPAVGIHPRRIQLCFFDDRKRLRGKRLVQLDHVHIGQFQSRQLQ